MADESTEKTAGPRARLPTEAAKYFTVRYGRKLVKHIIFHKGAGKRPDALRIHFSAQKATSVTLKNKDFFAQYRKAVHKLADWYKIPERSSVREEMVATARDFVEVYNLTLEQVTIVVGGKRIEVDNVAFPNVPADRYTGGNEMAQADANAPVQSSGNALQQYRAAFLPDGRVRGVSFKPRDKLYPALIYARTPKGNVGRFALENRSFKVQYARAIDFVAASLGLAPDDAMKLQMYDSAPAFLAHHGLTTRSITIPDVAVVVE